MENLIKTFDLKKGKWFIFRGKEPINNRYIEEMRIFYNVLKRE